ncbi:MAG: HEPN domain-containing protein [Candidatus Rokubacteria bacterium]|nr:HEPN domain-containing protein [Candidatus Rokubacteria bacterium]
MTAEKIVREWREYASRDWHRIHTMLREEDPLAAGFFLQQAVEKYLKAYLISQGWGLRKTHELDRLLDASTQYAAKLMEFRPLCERVSTYYVVERYPGVAGTGPDTNQVRRDLNEARVLILALFPDEQLD